MHHVVHFHLVIHYRIHVLFFFLSVFLFFLLFCSSYYFFVVVLLAIDYVYIHIYLFAFLVKMSSFCSKYGISFDFQFIPSQHLLNMYTKVNTYILSFRLLLYMRVTCYINSEFSEYEISQRTDTKSSFHSDISIFPYINIIKKKNNKYCSLYSMY